MTTVCLICGQYYLNQHREYQLLKFLFIWSICYSFEYDNGKLFILQRNLRKDYHNMTVSLSYKLVHQYIISCHLWYRAKIQNNMEK